MAWRHYMDVSESGAKGLVPLKTSLREPQQKFSGKPRRFLIAQLNDLYRSRTAHCLNDLLEYVPFGEREMPLYSLKFYIQISVCL